jgi:YD repeat-containing protein
VSTAIRKDGATITQSWRYLAGPLSGNLWYVTDAITDGEAVIYYTARDTIQTITPQGVTPGAAFEYDLRGRLTRSTVGGVVGNFAYDARGLYTEIRFSSGAVLQFRWNDAQQLIDIRDETGQVYAPQVAMGPDAVLPLGQALAQLYAQGRGVAERGLTALGDSLVPPAAAQVGVVPSRFLEALGLAAAAQRKPRDLGAGKCCAAGESLLSQAEGGSASDQMVLLSPWLMAGLLVTEIKDVVLDELMLRKGAKRLACNIEKARGETRGEGQVAHHIVSRYAGRADGARQVLKRVGMDLDDPNNGVILDASRHYGLHTKRYYEEVELALKPARTYADAVSILALIRVRIVAGTFP